MDIDMNLNEKKCTECGGDVEILRFDLNCVWLECKACGNQVQYAFQSEDEANFYMDEKKQSLFGRLREGFIDWQMTDWNQLYSDFISFMEEHPEFESDLQFRMAIVACLTNGFNRMDREKYRQCKSRFKVADKMYHRRLKLMETQIANSKLADSIEDYQMSRTKYVQLRNEYLQTKMIWKMVWNVAKLWLK